MKENNKRKRFIIIVLILLLLLLLFILYSCDCGRKAKLSEEQRKQMLEKYSIYEKYLKEEDKEKYGFERKDKEKGKEQEEFGQKDKGDREDRDYIDDRDNGDDGSERDDRDERKDEQEVDKNGDNDGDGDEKEEYKEEERKDIDLPKNFTGQGTWSCNHKKTGSFGSTEMSASGQIQIRSENGIVHGKMIGKGSGKFFDVHANGYTVGWNINWDSDLEGVSNNKNFDININGQNLVSPFVMPVAKGKAGQPKAVLYTGSLELNMFREKKLSGTFTIKEEPKSGPDSEPTEDLNGSWELEIID